MGADSKIEWTDHTFNAWIGCTKVSDGCKHCYAEVQTFPRVQRGKGIELWGANAKRHRTSPANWKQPLAWNREAESSGIRRRVFAQSLSDTFEDRRDLDAWRADLFALIESTPWLDWLLLTKRPENMVRLAPWKAWPRNVWAGCTVEDQQRADERIPHLLRVPAAVRFVSVEPLLGPIIFRGRHWFDCNSDPTSGGIGWAIIGGESGNGARPCDLAWIRSFIAWCEAAAVPVFVKQLGAQPVDGKFYGYADDPARPLRLRDRKGGDWSEWPADLRRREWPRGE